MDFVNKIIAELCIYRDESMELNYFGDEFSYEKDLTIKEK